MPKLNNDNLEQHTLPTGSYGYSAVSLNELGATEYTIVTIVQDTSSSVQRFKPEMEKAIAEIVKACRFSPRADNLLIRLTTFDSNMDEIHGFKLLSECNQDDYLDCLNVGGMTALFDATENAITATTDYAKTLTENDFDAYKKKRESFNGVKGKSYKEGLQFNTSPLTNEIQTQGRFPANLILSYPENEYICKDDLTKEQKNKLYDWLNENT